MLCSTRYLFKILSCDCYYTKQSAWSEQRQKQQQKQPNQEGNNNCLVSYLRLEFCLFFPLLTSYFSLSIYLYLYLSLSHRQLRYLQRPISYFKHFSIQKFQKTCIIILSSGQGGRQSQTLMEFSCQPKNNNNNTINLYHSHKIALPYFLPFFLENNIHSKIFKCMFYLLYKLK